MNQPAAVTFQGADGVQTFVATTLRRAIKLYKETGIKVNRAYTPTNMLAKATEITGVKFKRGQYQEAMDALTKWLEENGTTGR